MGPADCEGVSMHAPVAAFATAKLIMLATCASPVIVQQWCPMNAVASVCAANNSASGRVRKPSATAMPAGACSLVHPVAARWSHRKPLPQLVAPEA